MLVRLPERLLRQASAVARARSLPHRRVHRLAELLAARQVDFLSQQQRQQLPHRAAHRQQPQLQ